MQASLLKELHSYTHDEAYQAALEADPPLDADLAYQAVVEADPRYQPALEGVEEVKLIDEVLSRKKHPNTCAM